MEKQILDLDARQVFFCLASECPRTCCSGWDRIQVDSDTLEKWQQHKATEGKLSLLGLIERAADDVTVMSTDTERNCQAWDSDGLCVIQKSYGHDFLSDTCRNFPRLTSANPLRVYNSASLSCPAIVQLALFEKQDEDIFRQALCETQSDESQMEAARLYCALDDLVCEVLQNKAYRPGVILFFIVDVFGNFFNLAGRDQLTPMSVLGVQKNSGRFLAQINEEAQNGNIDVHPVTSGSFWKSVFELCLTRGVSERFMECDDGKLADAIEHCDGTYSCYEHIHKIVIEYSDKASLQLQNRFGATIRKFIHLVFINKGFPLAPAHPMELLLVDCIVSLCALQLLIWIEVNKTGLVSESFLKDCIVEVDRRFTQHDGVIKNLQQDPHMAQIDKYSPVLLNLF